MRTLKKYRTLYLFILSFLILFLLFQLVPTIWTVYISFMEWKDIGTPRSCGLKSYRKMMIDNMFWGALGDAAVYWVTGLVMILILTIVTACLLNSQALRGRAFFKAATFLLNIRAAIAMGLIFGMLFGGDIGLINELGNTMGFSKIPWLTGTRYPKIPVIILNIWRSTPWFATIVPSGLLSISRDYCEVAIVDGADNLKQFYYITLSSLKNILLFCSITLTVDSQKLFSEPHILPGPGISNTPLFQYMYESGFDTFNMGYVSAIGCILIVVLMIISVIQFAARRRQGEL